MPDPVIAVLKLVFLAGLYLFLARVVRAVWVEIYAERRSNAERIHAGVRQQQLETKPDANVDSKTTAKSESGRFGAKNPSRGDKKSPKPWQLKVVEPAEQKGTAYQVTEEMTIGRAPACAVPIRDDFASQLHARIFRQDSEIFVEDLGSTNGTFLNRKPVHGPVRIVKGDRIQIGNTVLELRK